MGIIVAIGGYKSEDEKARTFDTPLKIDRQIVKLTGKAHPKALFIPTASSDSDGYTEAWIQNYQDKLGCRVDVLRLIKEKPSFAEIEANILGADLIYVGGGNVLSTH